MFKSLEEAEKMFRRIPYQKEQRNNMRENERTFKELQEQDKKINELKKLLNT